MDDKTLFEKKHFTFLVIAAFLLFSILAAASFINGDRASRKTEIPIPTPLASGQAPIPFYEVTIPYLRGRSYDSRLGELVKFSENQSYTSYVTSYTSDDLKINGLLTMPIAKKPEDGWPAIVFVHGYIPPKSYQTTQNYASYVDVLARSGFVVFKIDLRGHADSQGEPGGTYYSSDYVIDTLNAYAALQSTGFVNPKEIGLWGHSMAGNVVFRAFAAKPDIPAVVIWAGAVYSYVDFAEYGISDASYQPSQVSTQSAKKRQELRALYGEPRLDSSFWQQVAPTSYLNDLKGAIQVNHAVNDPVVSAEYSRNLMRLLDVTSVVHELHEYPDGGHNISGAYFNKAMQNTVDFFKKYL